MKASGDGARMASLLMAGLGLVDAAYLAWIKLAGATAACGGIGDCDRVNNSRYAEIGGMPIALLGVGQYLLIVLLLLLEKRFAAQEEFILSSIFGIALAGTLYSGYLTYIEAAVLKAICPFCVFSAVLIAAILIISGFRLREMADEI